MLKNKFFYAFFNIFFVITFLVLNGVVYSKTNKVIIGPYLRDITPHSVMICWEEEFPSAGILYYGTNPEKLLFKKKFSKEKIHRVRLTNLQKGTGYFYRILSKKMNPNLDYSFRTSLEKFKRFVFAVYGDTSSGDPQYDINHQKIIQSIMQNTFPEFVILTGDLVSNGSKKNDWLDFFKIEKPLLINTPIFSVVGNNEQVKNSLFDTYMINPGKNEWYSFNYNNCHFIMLNVLQGKSVKYYKNFRPGSPQFTWLLDDLKSDANRKASFTFVIMHAPFYSPTEKLPSFLEPLLHPLFKKYGVDMTFSGTHSYTRADKDGIQYLISGGGGGADQNIKRNIGPKEIIDSVPLNHHLYIEVNYPTVNVSVIDTQGSIRSSFSYWDPKISGKKNIEKISTNIENYSNNNIIIFSAPNCGYCNYVRIKKIPKLAKDLGIKIPITYCSLDKPEFFEDLVMFEQKLNDTGNELPVIIIGDKILGGKKEIDKKLRDALKNFYEIKNKQVGQTENSNLTFILSEKIKSLQIIPVLFAGLLDGINPCAFTTIIFLLAYLYFTGRKKKEILIAGTSFSIGVFLTYILLGLGFSSVLNSLSVLPIISNVIKYFTLIMVFVLAILSLYDGCLALLGKAEQNILQLPAFFKKQIHNKIRQQTGKTSLFFSSFLLGFFVSMFEMACTGQVYLPTIVYMIKTGKGGMRIVGLLIAYNLMFILPLILVFILAYFGMKKEIVEKIFKKNIVLIRFLTAAFFIVLGLLVLVL